MRFVLCVLNTGQLFSEVELLLQSIDNPNLQSSTNQHASIFWGAGQQSISYSAVCQFLSLRDQSPARDKREKCGTRQERLAMQELLYLAGAAVGPAT